VPVKDIVYLETDERRVKVTLKDEIIYYSGKLTDLLSELPDFHFVRCHRSFAVNISKIHSVFRNKDMAVNGVDTLIPISRTYLKDVKNAILRQLSEEAISVE